MRGGVRAVVLGVVLLTTFPSLATADTPAWSDLVELAAGAQAGGVGIDGEGAVTATWRATGPRQAFVATRPAGASAFGPPLALGPPGSVAPQVAVNEAGAAIVTWDQEGTSRCHFAGVCSSEAWLRVRAPGARDFGPAIQLEEHVWNQPSLALNERGEFVVSWATFDGAVEVAEGSVRGGPGPSLQLAPGGSGDKAWSTEAAIGETGAAIVAWSVISPSGPRPLFAAYRPAGGVFGPPEVASAGSFGAGPSAIVDPRGTATVAFQTGFAEAAIAVRPPDGRFSPPRAVVPSGAVQLRQDPAGNQFAYWSTFGVGENTVPESWPYASIRSPGSEWSEPYPILPRDSYPVIDLDGRGNAVALYTTPPRAGQRLRAATLTRFDLVERAQALNETTSQVQQLSVNHAGSAVGLVTEYRDHEARDGGAVVLITQRPADETPARVRLTATAHERRLDLTARCDEICRLRPRPRGRPLTLQAHRRGRMSVRLGKTMRARLARGRAIELAVRAVDVYGNVRVARRRVERRH